MLPYLVLFEVTLFASITYFDILVLIILTFSMIASLIRNT